MLASRGTNKSHYQQQIDMYPSLHDSGSISYTMTIKLVMMAVIALGLLSAAAGHVCPPCKHDIQVKQNVGRMAHWCATEFDHGLLAFNRTLQLLEVLSENTGEIPGCQTQASTLQSFVREAAVSLAATVSASAEIRADVAGFVSSDLYPDYAEYTSAFKDKLQALGRSAQQSERSLGAGLGEVLESCFQETPLRLPELSLDTESVVDQLMVSDDETKQSGGGNVLLAWGLTLLAGASTVMGAGLVGIIDANQHSLIAFLNAFTAGIMVQGSVSGLTKEAAVLLADSAFNVTTAFWTIFMMFFLGIALCVALELLVHKLVHIKATQGQVMPSAAQTASMQNESDRIKSFEEDEDETSTDLSQTSVIVMVAGVSLHNIAEGMATFIAAMANARLGMALAIGMVLHNVPEGFAISVPWYASTGKRWQGFLLASVAGAAEVLSALVIYIVTMSVGDVQVRQTVFACLFALAGGMMTFIALIELYPAAIKKMPNSSWPGIGIFTGFAVMYLALGQMGIPNK